MGKSEEFKAMNESGRKNINNQYIIKKYKCLDEDGLPKVGVSIQSGDIYVNKKVPVVSQ
jgi:DNA-directed RNA polymerase beta subunit